VADPYGVGQSYGRYDPCFQCRWRRRVAATTPLAGTLRGVRGPAFYGFLRENYEEYLAIEAGIRKTRNERDQAQRDKEMLEQRWADKERRIMLKNALSAAVQEGTSLHDSNPSSLSAGEWAFRVGCMIAFALDMGERRLFEQKHPKPSGEDPGDSEAKRIIRRRLPALYDLIPRVDSLNVNPDFHSRDWIGTHLVRVKKPAYTQQVESRLREAEKARGEQQTAD
jgi:hypothetical protein